MTAAIAMRVTRAALVLAAVWATLSVLLPTAMSRYQPFSLSVGAGFGCARVGGLAGPGSVGPLTDCGRSLAEVYATTLPALILDAAIRSLVLLAGAGLLALVLGTLIGGYAATHRHAAGGAGVVGFTSVLGAIPAFFVAYFLQMLIIVLGSVAGHRILPVFGFGYDDHIILPLLAVSVPAVMTTAQLAATRLGDLLDEDFVTTARAKGLLDTSILRVHVLPHALPVIVEGVGNGLRISVASLPIVEYLFVWNGLGFIALQSIASRDAAALTASAVVLAALFAALGVIADLVRPRAR